MQYHSRICFFVVAFKIVSYFISFDVSGVFTVINGDWNPEKQIHEVAFKKSIFRKCAKKGNEGFLKIN